MSNTHRWASVAILVAASATVPAHSQSSDSVRIRLYRTDKVVAQGQLLGRAGDKVVIRAYGQSADYALDPNYVVERYQTGRATTTGALLGGAIGAGVGFMMTPRDEDKCDSSDGLLCADISTGQAFAASVVGFGVGAGVGALLGSLFKRKGWSGINPHDIPDNGPSLSLNLAPGKIGMALGFRW